MVRGRRGEGGRNGGGREGGKEEGRGQVEEREEGKN